MSGGSDISFLGNLRVPCAITLGLALLLIALAIGSCVACMTAEPEPGSGPTDLALTAG